MSTFLSFDVVGQPALEKKIAALSEALDTRAILDEGSAVIFNRIRTRFLQEVDPNGVRWPPSHAARRRAQRNEIGGTLFESGKLFRSLQLYADSPISRAIGTDAKSSKGFPYPLIHNFGLAGQTRRQFLGFGNEDAETMLDVVLRRVTEGLAK